MKIVIIGGHLTPALSVIESLKSDAQIIYIGRKNSLEGDKAVSLEYETISKRGIKFYTLKTGRLQRRFTKHTIPSLTKIPFGFFQSLKILKEFKPDVVVGFGGYVSVPVIIAAKSLKIPVIIHEQTMEVGAANKFLSKFADKICISFESSKKYFPTDKVILTGNPIRKSIINPVSEFKLNSKDPVIYITGGSQGSHFINNLIINCLPKLLEKYTVIHQTGAALEFNDYEKLNILREGLNKNKEKYIISKFFSTDEIGSILKAATIVIGRAGINSVSEIIVLRKPAFLIPLPVSQKDEQLINANLVKKVGLGEIYLQKDLNPDNFLIEINKMIKNINEYKFIGNKKNFPTDSAQKIIDIIYDFQKDSN